MDGPFYVTKTCLKRYQERVLGLRDGGHLHKDWHRCYRREILRILSDLARAEPLGPRARIVFSRRSVDPDLEHYIVDDLVYAVKRVRNGKRPTIVTTVVVVDEQLARALDAVGEDGDAPASVRRPRPPGVIVDANLVPFLQRIYGSRSREELTNLVGNALVNAVRIADDCRRTALGQEPVPSASYWRDGRLYLGINQEAVLVDVVYRRSHAA